MKGTLGGRMVQFVFDLHHDGLRRKTCPCAAAHRLMPGLVDGQIFNSFASALRGACFWERMFASGQLSNHPTFFWVYA